MDSTGRSIARLRGLRARSAHRSGFRLDKPDPIATGITTRKLVLRALGGFPSGVIQLHRPVHRDEPRTGIRRYRLNEVQWTRIALLSGRVGGGVRTGATCRTATADGRRCTGGSTADARPASGSGHSRRSDDRIGGFRRPARPQLERPFDLAKADIVLRISRAFDNVEDPEDQETTFCAPHRIDEELMLSS